MPSRAHIRVAIRTRPTAAFDQDEIFIDPVNKVSCNHDILSPNSILIIVCTNFASHFF